MVTLKSMTMISKSEILIFDELGFIGQKSTLNDRLVIRFFYSRKNRNVLNEKLFSTIRQAEEIAIKKIRTNTFKWFQVICGRWLYR